MFNINDITIDPELNNWVTITDEYGWWVECVICNFIPQTKNEFLNHTHGDE